MIDGGLMLAALLMALAFVMGLGIHRGNICAVVAVRELIRDRRGDRFFGFFECSLWATLTLWLAAETLTISDWSPILWVAAGAIMFGIGAVINGACAFGTVNWLGTGRLDFLLTAVGAWGGFKLVEHAFSSLLPPSPSVSFTASPWTLVIVAAGVPLLMASRWWLGSHDRRALVSLSLLMALIGVVSTMLAILHQPWPWLSVIVRSTYAGNRLAYWVLAALLFGAVVGGVVTGRFRWRRPTLADLRDRLIGGALMGLGTAVIPGGNDALIFYGLPSGDPVAFSGYLIMLATIAAVLIFARHVTPFWRGGGSATG